jgi:serine protease Do
MSEIAQLKPGIRSRTGLATALVLAFAVVFTPPARAAWSPDGLPDLVTRLLPSVVNITSRTLVTVPTNSLSAASSTPGTGDGTPDQRAKTTVGSGFVIDPDGLIVTNNHVIEGAFDLSATFQDGTVANATVVGTSKIGDIALLKVNLNRKLPSVTFSDNSKLRVGQQVIAIGNPLGFGGTVSTGIVSALNRDIMISPFDDFIQTDAALNHGNSGGPLFNLDGEVIGVNTALYSPLAEGGSIGLGFAIPAYCAQFVIGQLREFGIVRAGEVGLKLQDVSGEIAHAAGLPASSRTIGILPGSAGWGVIVTSVVPDGPAAVAGLKDGDILLTINEEPIADVRAFARIVAVHPLNQKVRISAWRDGATLVLSPVVREWATGQATDRAALARTTVAREARMDMGLQLAALSPDERKARELPTGQNGVLITRVIPGSIASDRGLADGDVILKVANREVSQPNDVLTGLRGMIEANNAMVLLLVQGKAGLRWVPLPIDTGLAATMIVKQKG